MLIRTGVALLTMVACAPRATVVVPPTVRIQEPAPSSSGGVSSPEAYTLVWGQHQVETSGCFFFSGPPLPNNEVVNPLGDSVEVRRSEGRLSVSIDGVTFSGEPRSGPTRLELNRSFTSGEKWHVTETLELDSGDAPRSGTYRYRECPESQGRGCVSACTIDSEFSFVN